MPSVQLSLLKLPTPALVLDLDRLQSNIECMASHAARLGVVLRPHVKTHKSVQIAGMQIAAGAQGLTVSTLEEAAAMAAAGYDDLTWALPVILNRLDEVRELAGWVKLRLLVDSPQAIAALEECDFPFHVWLKVDCGYGRAGVDPRSEHAVAFAQRLSNSPSLRFDGLLTHGGHAYSDDRPTVAAEERRVMVELAAKLRAAGIAVPAVSIGSTPGMTACEDLQGIDEARPGNYVFFDYSQIAMGSCAVADCALTVLASVVSCQPDASHSVVDAGALALSKDPGPDEPPTFGALYANYSLGSAAEAPELSSARLSGLSQEHGIVDRPLPVGSRVRIQPNHSCLAVACFDHYTVVRGDRVVDRWKIHRQR